MKTLLTTLIIAILVVPAFAQDEMGVSADPTMHETYIFVEAGTPFNFYIVLLDPSSSTIGGYEMGLSFVGGDPFILGVTGPNGWTNFGSNLNHLVGYTTPIPAADMVVLSTLNTLVAVGPFSAIVVMGASDPSSFDGMGPGYADGTNPDILVLCSVPADGAVGLITTEVVATEASTLSDVKSLFE